ncbi:helix-turn-helix domain-containing protein [Pantoea coffeiphila]|uniref:helix-turn-helix domain-containing protein n=1 Tax=Pantoea coffeiphila TaxID=1465635 RepID=UPI001960BA7B|nr:AraC family transcriptional regulator [Pantoea coffeiphila]MBM7342788.1 AraC-like DNA-binding protein [Pantoea coffeiphila]
MSNLPSSPAAATLSLSLTGGGEGLLFSQPGPGLDDALSRPGKKLLLLFAGEILLTDEHADTVLRAGEMLRCDSPHRLKGGPASQGILLSSELLNGSALAMESVTPQPAGLQILLRELFPAADQGALSLSRFYLRAKCHELLVCVQTQRQAERTVSGHQQDVERIRLVLAILQQDLASPPALPELARQVGISETRLKRLFRELHGSPVFACLRELRLLQARHLIESGDLPLAEIALQVGMRSGGYFARAYRARFGLLPHEARTGREDAFPTR